MKIIIFAAVYFCIVSSRLADMTSMID